MRQVLTIHRQYRLQNHAVGINTLLGVRAKMLAGKIVRIFPLRSSCFYIFRPSSPLL